MAEASRTGRGSAEKAERRVAGELVAEFHKQELRRLLEHVRAGFVRLDSGEIDEFELDDLIHRYKRAAAKLWSFCGSGGGRSQEVVSALAYLRERNEAPPDWWEEAAPRKTGT